MPPATLAAVSASQAGVLTFDGVFARSRANAAAAASSRTRSRSPSCRVIKRTVRKVGFGSSAVTVNR